MSVRNERSQYQILGGGEMMSGHKAMRTCLCAGVLLFSVSVALCQLTDNTKVAPVTVSPGTDIGHAGPRPTGLSSRSTASGFWHGESATQVVRGVYSGGGPVRHWFGHLEPKAGQLRSWRETARRHSCCTASQCEQGGIPARSADRVVCERAIGPGTRVHAATSGRQHKERTADAHVCALGGSERRDRPEPARCDPEALGWLIRAPLQWVIGTGRDGPRTAGVARSHGAADGAASRRCGCSLPLDS